MNIVVRIDSKGEITLIGRETIGKVAEKIMKEDFETFFWEKFESSADVSFEELYEEYAEDECCLGERSAWMHGCNGTDLSWVVLETACDTVRTRPYSQEEILLRCNEELYLDGEVLIDMNEIFDGLENFLDILSMRLIDSPLLTDISYEVVDVMENNLLVLKVRGGASEALEITDEISEKLKSKLFSNGIETIEEFAAMDLSFEEKDTIDNILDDVISQMPLEEFTKWYKQLMM